MKIATLFEHYGPYHVARINGAIKNCGRHEIVPIELFGKCQTYAWTKPAHSEIDSHVVFPQLDSVSASKPQIRTGIAGLLDDLKPDVVAVHGWSLPGATETIRWANRNGASVVVMSESRAEDSPRSAAKEFVKRKILGHVSSGLVGAPSHAAYLAQLGIPNDAIFQGYNAVDNDYFAIETKRIRAEKSSDTMPHLPAGFPQKHFFASCRFIEKKNLRRLIDAYADYRQTADRSWGLVIAGDGPLKDELLQHAARLGLQDSIQFPGFVQYDELPIYYGFASAFVHVSTVEQWGLVVNEAAASSLPLVVSESTGCAECLVDDGVNGFLCDSLDTGSITRALNKMASLSNTELTAMGKQSSDIVADYGPDQFGKGLIKAAQYAVDHPRKPSWLGKMIVSLLS